MFMKRQITFLWAAFAFLVALPGCNPYYTPSISMPPRSALVTVECRDLPDVRQNVLQLLRSGRGKDISMKTDGSCLEIAAAYMPADIPPGKLEQILQDLNNLNGVLRVEVGENPRPIRQNF
jgi:hypothetical protein